MWQKDHSAWALGRVSVLNADHLKHSLLFKGAMVKTFPEVSLGKNDMSSSHALGLESIQLAGSVSLHLICFLSFVQGSIFNETFRPSSCQNQILGDQTLPVALGLHSES